MVLGRVLRQTSGAVRDEPPTRLRLVLAMLVVAPVPLINREPPTSPRAGSGQPRLRDTADPATDLRQQLRVVRHARTELHLLLTTCARRDVEHHRGLAGPAVEHVAQRLERLD